MEKISRMKELAAKLNEASKAYYAESREIMSNYEYDQLYDELLALEKETGTVLAGSPTQKVGYEAVTELPKERHEKPMLSLDKTKDREVLRAFIGRQKTLISWKLDGLTVVLTYRNGQLFKAVTRGNGEIGEVITPNARTFINIPLKIPYRGELILRGEAVISYPDFEKINETLGEAGVLYKNPRNLCSGSVRQLDSSVTARRNVRFFAFALVRADGVDFHNSRMEQFHWLKSQGFEVVEHKETDASGLDEVMAYYEEKIKTYEIPSDGLVALYDDIAYGDSLGTTAKFPRNAFAFKWQDELAETTLRSIEWSPSRTGLINPVAVFDPVELEGTTVQRASVHNLSIMKSMKLGIGDKICVFKANMIIPQIAENLTKSGNLRIPDKCPACGGPTEIHQEFETETLFCPNPDCPAKKIKSYAQFVSRNAMNIDGLSEMTLEKFLGRGFLQRFGDLFRLRVHRDDIISMEGFGQKSFDNLMDSLERSKDTTVSRLLFALGIPNFGVANARVIADAFHSDFAKIRNASEEELMAIDGVGAVMAASFVRWFRDPKNAADLDDLLTEIRLEQPQPQAQAEGAGESGRVFDDRVFVVTGAVNHFKNRDELKECVLSLGGKVTGSVSKNTDYLINNDAASASTKNRKARELGVPVITEDEFIAMLPESARPQN